MNQFNFIINNNSFEVTVRMGECRISIIVYSIKLAMQMEIFRFLVHKNLFIMLH